MDETLAAKLDAMHQDLKELKMDVKSMNGRQRSDHDRVVKLEERTNLVTGAQAALTLVASTIAAWLGIRQ